MVSCELALEMLTLLNQSQMEVALVARYHCQTMCLFVVLVGIDSAGSICFGKYSCIVSLMNPNLLSFPFSGVGLSCALSCICSHFVGICIIN